MLWNENDTKPQKISACAIASSDLKDHGPNPLVINIESLTTENENFRTALWTGAHLQVTLMCINPGEDIGLEMHPNLDQFIRIENGKGYVEMGSSKDNLDLKATIYEGCAILIPACTWHNLINSGCVPIKLYSIYAPPEHPFGTIHKTRDEAEHHH